MFENFSIIFQSAPVEPWYGDIIRIVIPAGAAVLGAWWGAKISRQSHEQIFDRQNRQNILKETRMSHTFLVSLIETTSITKHINYVSSQRYSRLIEEILEPTVKQFTDTPEWVGRASKALFRCADNLEYMFPQDIPNPWSFSAEERTLIEPNLLAKCFEIWLF